MATANKDSLRSFGGNAQSVDIESQENEDENTGAPRPSETLSRKRSWSDALATDAFRLGLLDVGFALAGITFPNPRWYLHALQVMGLGAQGWSLYSIINRGTERARKDNGESHQESDNLLLVCTTLIQVLPWLFLWYLARSRQRIEVRKSFKNPKRHKKGWMVILPWAAPFCLLVLGSWMDAHENGVDAIRIVETVFSLGFHFFPACVGIATCFAYVVDLGTPREEASIGALKNTLNAFEAANKLKMNGMGMLFIIPNVLVWLTMTLVLFYRTLNQMKENQIDQKNDDPHHKADMGSFYFYAFRSLFSTTFMFCFIIPPAYHTTKMDIFLKETYMRYCNVDCTTGELAVILWLQSQPHGWKIMNIPVSLRLFKTIAFAVGTVTLSVFARAVEY